MRSQPRSCRSAGHVTSGSVTKHGRLGVKNVGSKGLRRSCVVNISQTRRPWDCQSGLPRNGQVVVGVNGAAYMAVPWSVWV